MSRIEQRIRSPANANSRATVYALIEEFVPFPLSVTAAWPFVEAAVSSHSIQYLNHTKWYVFLADLSVSLDS